MIHLLILGTLLAIVVAMDLRDRRIPNSLIVIGTCLALLLGMSADTVSLAAASLGLVLGLAVGIGLFAMGAVGAGDGKLLGMLGAFLGPWGLAHAVLYAGIVGGIMALAYAARRRTLIPVLLRTRELGLHLLTFGRSGERWTVDSPGAASIPFALPIAVGALLALAFPVLSGAL